MKTEPMAEIDITPGTDDRFERIGTTYYKIVRQPNAAGQLIERSIPWTIEAIRQDYGKDFLANVPKYDGFCCVRSHLDYQPVVGNFKNKYSPLSHIPSEGEWQCIESLVRHIFGDQYELGLDYLQILYTMPLQKLPILLLVSEERNTGKSTFLNFLKLLFEANVTFNTNENFRSQFNDDWNGKLVIVVDEVLLNKREDSERLKNLSTTRNYKMEAKGRDREEVSFFAKFVLCSNNEYLPVVIDPGETRYWVRKKPNQTEPKPNQNRTKTEQKNRIVELITANPTITRAELSKELDLHESSVQRHLDALVKEERIRQIGPTNGGTLEILEPN